MANGNFDVIAYALGKEAGGGGGGGTSGGYKGTVATADELPDTASKGDMYIVSGEDNALYIYDTEWLVSSTSAITNAEIDALFE